MSILGPLCTVEIIEGSLFGCQSFMSDARRPEWKNSDLHPVKKGYSILFGNKRGGTHQSLIVDRDLLRHLLSW